MLYRIKHTLFFLLVTGLISSCAAPAATATSAPVRIDTLPPPTLALPTESIADPAAVVQGFWDALKEQDLEAAMTFVADDVQCRGGCYLTGKESLQSFLNARLKSGTIYEINDLQVEGDTVNYTYSKSRNGFLEVSGVKETMRVQNGKIIYWEVG
jgi:hypothetical protein